MLLTYSYDNNLSGISRGSYGSRELMVTYKLYKSYRCKNCWYWCMWRVFYKKL